MQSATARSVNPYYLPTLAGKLEKKAGNGGAYMKKMVGLRSPPSQASTTKASKVGTYL